jgi:hypothetical protein
MRTVKVVLGLSIYVLLYLPLDAVNRVSGLLLEKIERAFR